MNLFKALKRLFHGHDIGLHISDHLIMPHASKESTPRNRQERRLEDKKNRRKVG